jgi:hypothetical protein
MVVGKSISGVPTPVTSLERLSALAIKISARSTKTHDVFDRLEAGVPEVILDHSDLDRILREAIFHDTT